MKPKFKHDCDKCVYLGSYSEEELHEKCTAVVAFMPRDYGKYFDLYFCGAAASEGHTTVVARYGDRGPDYVSGLHYVNAFPEIHMAAILAVKKGLLSEKDIPGVIRFRTES